MDSVAPKIDTTNANIIGLFFSGSYCKYCKEFTPILIDNYQKLLNHNIDIVYVASDKTEDAYNEYRATQPWQALNYADVGLRVGLRERFNIKTIPALLFFDVSQNVLIEADGRHMLTNDCDGLVNQLVGNVIIDYNSDDSDF